jgi:hypothetical protein
MQVDLAVGCAEELVRRLVLEVLLERLDGPVQVAAGLLRVGLVSRIVVQLVERRLEGRPFRALAGRPARGAERDRGDPGRQQDHPDVAWHGYALGDNGPAQDPATCFVGQAFQPDFSTEESGWKA